MGSGFVGRMMLLSSDAKRTWRWQLRILSIFFAGRDSAAVPHPGRPVIARGHDARTVGAIRRGIDVAPMALELCEKFPGLRLPLRARLV